METYLNDKNISNYSEPDLDYLRKPMNKAMYACKTKDEFIYEDGLLIKRIKRSHWSDRVKCKECSGEYTRSAKSNHDRTQKHQIYSKLNKKLLNYLTINNVEFD